MSDDPTTIELTPQEREVLGSLSREKQPPDHLEGRVVTALADRGLLRTALSRRQPGLAQLAAAAVLILSVGFLAGRWTTLTNPQPTEPKPAEPQTAEFGKFMLLLYDTPEREALRSPERNRQLASEYTAWAREIAQAGHFVGGDPLRLDGDMLRRIDGNLETRPLSSEAGGEVVVGYFTIQAEDYSQALAIASDCPHLGQGGVLVRPLGHS